MNDDPAVLYFRRDGAQYRVKAFDATIWIEAQPGGDNLPYPRADHPVFDGKAWDFDSLVALVDIYRADCGGAQQQPASGRESGTRHASSLSARACRRRR